ncbi:hypothetical protein J2T09_000242 [Neorhizobium huautlense]|uniref:Transposase n=1 Tax=Neorhizobium huautlense TaxID=67774 RepID=A0ABT9PM28_9HYPH|nr:hypothetical protein [Neorhizobium huautlense]
MGGAGAEFAGVLTQEGACMTGPVRLRLCLPVTRNMIGSPRKERPARADDGSVSRFVGVKKHD